MRPSEPAEKYRVVGVRSDGSEAVLARDLPVSYAEAIREALDDPRVFFEIRVETTERGRGDR